MLDLEVGRKALMGGSVGASAPFMVARASGSLVWDTDGKRYIDGTAQAWSLSIGHCHPAVIAAVREHLDKYTQIRTSFDTEPKLLLAKKLTEIAPGNLKRVAFCLSGSEAMEGAMKLAMRDGRSQTFVSLWDGFHGRTLGTMSISWPHPGNPFSEWTGPVVRIPQAYCYRCPVGKNYPNCKMECVDLARREMTETLEEAPAAIVMEPFQGNGGMIGFPPFYLKKMREMADDFGTLLILDEIQTGMGRTGEWFACQHENVKPDIMVIGKGLGGGFPLFGTMVDERVKGFQPGDHSFTFAHFSPSMVAALATIDVIEKENLLGRVQKVGQQVRYRLMNMQGKYHFIGDVRGLGLMVGVELVSSHVTKKPAPRIADRVVALSRERGLLLGESKYGGLGNVIKFKPPLNIPQELVDESMDILDGVFAQVSKERDMEEE